MAGLLRGQPQLPPQILIKENVFIKKTSLYLRQVATGANATPRSAFSPS
jgi:hypothetical protein